MTLPAYDSGATLKGHHLELCNIHPMSSMWSLDKELIFAITKNKILFIIPYFMVLVL